MPGAILHFVIFYVPTDALCLVKIGGGRTFLLLFRASGVNLCTVSVARAGIP